MNEGNPLDTFRRGPMIDLSSRGFIDKKRKLRRENKAKERSIERRLDPTLIRRAFPRTQIPWYATSEGMRVRLALADENPHLQQDINEARTFLGRPTEEVRGRESDPLWLALEQGTEHAPMGWEELTATVAQNTPAAWLQVHREYSAGLRPHKVTVQYLTRDNRDLAQKTGGVSFGGPEVPAWLSKRADDAGANKESYRPGAPVDYIVQRLLQRHRLPEAVRPAVENYLITGEPRWMRDLSYVASQVRVEPSTTTPSAFEVSVTGIDEFWTQEEWISVYQRFIKPRQHFLWRERGLNPRGNRSISITRLKAQMPLYTEIASKKTPKQTAIRRIDPNLDKEAIRDVINDLESVLDPVV